MKRVVYSIVRFVPDVVRGEVFNVGVIVADDSSLVVKGLVAPTRLLLVSMSANDIAAVLELKDYITSAFNTWSRRKLQAAPVAFLEAVAINSPEGFIVDKPLERSISNEAISDVADRLFSRLVVPQRIYRAMPMTHKPKATTVVKDLLAINRFSYDLVPRHVTVRSLNHGFDYAFDFACANGRLTFGQSIDLDLKSSQSQAKNAFEAIANAADIMRVFESASIVNAVTVPKNHFVEQSSWERLKRWGLTFALPDEEEAFLSYIQRNSEHDVAAAVRKLGHQVSNEDGGIEILVEDESPPLSPVRAK